MCQLHLLALGGTGAEISGLLVALPFLLFPPSSTNPGTAAIRRGRGESSLSVSAGGKSSSNARALHLADDCPRLTHVMGYPRPLRRARGPAGPGSSMFRRPLCRPDLPSARAGSCETARRRERRWKPEKVQQKVPLLLAKRYFYFLPSTSHTAARSVLKYARTCCRLIAHTKHKISRCEITSSRPFRRLS